MGFKFKRVDLVAGSTEFPSGSSDALRRSRAETIVTKCVQAIIGSNCGWALDTTKNATITDFVEIPSQNSNLTYPGLFLINNSSGCKLFVCYNSNKNINGIKDFSGTGADIFQLNNDGTRFISGLCMSMIPEGSTSTFGDPTTTTFLPSDATRLIGTVCCYYNKNDYGAFGWTAASGYVCSYGLFINDKTICVCAKQQQNTRSNLGVPVYAIGKIFGTLIHSEDNSSISQYGLISFRSCTDVKMEGDLGIISYNSGAMGTSRAFIGNDPNQTLSAVTGIATAGRAVACIAKANGTWIGGTNGNTFGITLYPDNVGQLSSYIFDSANNGKSRWTPFVVCVFSNSLSTDGVVSGDGMKGYLDTDLFRCAIGTYGQQFDNGDFICVDSTYSLLLGWDSTNTDSIAGT